MGYRFTKIFKDLYDPPIRMVFEPSFFSMEELKKDGEEKDVYQQRRNMPKVAYFEL